jgi:hypothetical protein
MPIAAIFAEEAALALASELAPYAAGEAALAAGTVLGTEALLGLGAEAIGAGAVGGAEAALGAEAMAANAAAGGAGAGASGINAAQVAAQQNAAMQLANPGITGIPEAVMSPAQQAYMEASSVANTPGITQGVKPLPAYNNAFPTFNGPVTSPVSGFEPIPSFEGATTGPQGASPGFFNPTQAPGQGPLQYQLNAPNASQGLRLGSSLESSIAAPQMTSVLQPPSALEAGMDKAVKFAKANPFTAMTGAYMGANALGLLNPSGATFNNEPYDGPLSRYKLSPNFQGSTVNPADFQYTPIRYAGGGGIMSGQSYDIPVGYAEGEMVNDVPEYARGGSLSDSITEYQKMLKGQPQAAPAASRDVGIYYDQDPDTRYQDALTAAQIRQSKVNQRAYVSAPAAKRPTPLGKLNLPTSAKSKGNEVEAASGGIMQSSLGGYAAGGNPRLLKGPGDGMSDNIPATINGRQPARLADGEFVIPADVVSHLGNGSTEAGAKHLHAMMNKVRKARTGNPKQGKQIKPQKYMPK